MKYRSQRYNINRLKPRNRHKYSKHKLSLSIMMVIYTKQHLTNIWISVHEKVKQRWGWVEKSVTYKKARNSLRFVQLEANFDYNTKIYRTEIYQEEITQCNYLLCN